jgi:hypothetical protein
VVCSVPPAKHGRPSPWGEDDAWWRQADQQSPYTGAVSFRAAGSQGSKGDSPTVTEWMEMATEKETDDEQPSRVEAQ